jgi:hypothetical protein
LLFLISDVAKATPEDVKKYTSLLLRDLKDVVDNIDILLSGSEYHWSPRQPVFISVLFKIHLTDIYIYNSRYWQE